MGNFIFVRSQSGSVAFHLALQIFRQFLHLLGFSNDFDRHHVFTRFIHVLLQFGSDFKQLLRAFPDVLPTLFLPFLLKLALGAHLGITFGSLFRGYLRRKARGFSVRSVRNLETRRRDRMIVGLYRRGRTTEEQRKNADGDPPECTHRNAFQSIE